MVGPTIRLGKWMSDHGKIIEVTRVERNTVYFTHPITSRDTVLRWVGKAEFLKFHTKL